MIDRSRMLNRVAHRSAEGVQNVCEWKIINLVGEGIEWDAGKWKNEIEKAVREEGLAKWKMDMERKRSLDWYKVKKVPSFEIFYDGSLGSDLLFRARTQCLDVNARNYRWSESHSKVCQMCDYVIRVWMRQCFMLYWNVRNITGKGRK